MTNQRLVPEQAQYQPGGGGSLKSLAQALDKLFFDQTSFLHLDLPERAVAEIQRNFTINSWGSSGITDDACG
jgi:hypothetical protein